MPAAFYRNIEQEIFDRPQQKGTEAAAVGIGKLEKVSLHDHEEKILGQILSVRRGITAAINEGKDRSPIDLAELGKARIDLAGGAWRASLAKQAPARSDKMGEGPGTFDGGRRSHAPSVNGSPGLLKNKLGNSI